MGGWDADGVREGLGEPVGYSDGEGVEAGCPGADDGDGDGACMPPGEGDGECMPPGDGDGVGAGRVGRGDGSGTGGRVSGWCRVVCCPTGVPDMTPATTAPATATAANPSRSPRWRRRRSPQRMTSVGGTGFASCAP